jgi:hypothetical protein
VRSLDIPWAKYDLAVVEASDREELVLGELPQRKER